MVDYSYSDFISKKIVFATSVGGEKPLLKQSKQIFSTAKAENQSSSCKNKCRSSLSIASKKQIKSSSF